MNDFSDEVRQGAWWSTDSRRAVSGQLVDVIREKRGDKDRDNLDDEENVQMGLRLQGTIGLIFEEQTGISVKALDIAGTHPTETWLRSHADFETGDGGLLEVKNYNAAVINKYSEPDEPLRIPETDFIQCVHEATVFGKPHVWFAVLFGGQRFRYWKIDVTDDMKLQFIQRAAKWWADACLGTISDPTSVEEARYSWQHDDGTSIVATAAVENLAQHLKEIKAAVKDAETKESQVTLMLQKFMQDHSSIVTVDGRTLVTWKEAKGAKRFSSSLFKQAYPDLYDSFVVEQAGSRRFLVK
jgi:predicted phage-related endonuclease